MSLQSSVLSFLQVRKSESKLVWRLFIFEFFQGAALAIVFTTAITLFLQQLPIQDFPKVFVLSAFLLWLAAYIYHKLEHIFSAAKLVLVVLLFNMASILFFALMINQETKPWYLFAFLATFNILYLLNNLEFWGLASLLFDVRQSKRLFSVVSASDLPAKLCGYLLTAALVPVIGTENLLWVAMGCMIVSLLLYNPLVSLEEIKSIPESDHSHHHARHTAQHVEAAFITNNLIRILALISLFSMCCLIVVNVILYGYIKHEFKDDKEMQSFFAIFLATVRLITLIVKTGVTNRLADKLGLQKSLLITPVILLALCLTDLFFSMRPGYGHEKSALYVFGIMALFTDVLRMAIQSPVMLAAMQPLPTHDRLRGHTILKGLTDPFAFLAMGSLMWFMSTEGKELNLEVLGFVLLGLIICWIIAVLFIDKQYAAVLTTAIKDRTLNEKFISITDKESLQLLLEKIKTGNETEAIGVLKLINPQTSNQDAFFSAAFAHPSVSVKKYALTLFAQNPSATSFTALTQMAEQPAYTEILPDILDTIGNLYPQQDISGFIAHHSLPAAAKAVNISLRQNTDAKKTALEKIQQWLNSPRSEEKQTGLQLAGNSGEEQFVASIKTLALDNNPAIRKEALNAAAIHGNAQLSAMLLDIFLQHENDKEVVYALAHAKGKSLAGIKDYLLKNNGEGSASTKLVDILGKNENPASIQILEECASIIPGKITLWLPALLRKNIQLTEKKAAYQNILGNLLSAASHIISSIHFLSTKKSDNINLLNALHAELNEIKDQCLGLFALLYDSNKIKKVREGLRTNTKESTANALELIHVNIPAVYSEKFIHAFEANSIQEKYLSLQRYVKASPPSEEMIMKNILFDVDYYYNAWTKACVLYSYKDKPLPFNKAFIQPFTIAESAVLREMATVVFSKN
ncbi:MAG: MFS transporter [Agriterribacter sp.]